MAPVDPPIRGDRAFPVNAIALINGDINGGASEAIGRRYVTTITLPSEFISSRIRVCVRTDTPARARGRSGRVRSEREREMDREAIYSSIRFPSAPPSPLISCVIGRYRAPHTFVSTRRIIGERERARAHTCVGRKHTEKETCARALRNVGGGLDRRRLF